MQTTLDIIDDYITDARTLLQDEIQPYRYDDLSLVRAMNVTLLEGRRLRADLFVFCRENGGMVPHYASKSGQPVPIEPPFRLAFLHGLVGHALERDQEDIQDNRAALFLKIFNDLLLGVRPSSLAPAAQGTPQ